MATYLNIKLKINRILILQLIALLFQKILSNQIPDINKTIILPLKQLEIPLNTIIKEKSSDPLGLIINKIIPNNLYLQLNINSHEIELRGYITFNSQYNYFGIDSCVKIENTNKYKIMTPIEIISGLTLFYNKYQEYYHLKENITIYTINNNYYFNEIDLIIPEDNEREAECIILGLNPNSNDQSNVILKNFPLSMKANSNKNFKSYLTILYNYSRVYNIDNKTSLTFGEPPHILYPNIFNKGKYKEIDNFKIKNENKNLFSKDSKSNQWSIEINKISFKKGIIYRNNYIGLFSLDYIPLLLPMELFSHYIDNYFKKYIDNKICYKKGRPLSNKFAHTVHDDKKQTFIFIYCEKNKIENISKFYDSMPTLKLRNDLLNKTFEFSSKELFVEEDGNIYLMLIPDLFSELRITLGRIFMEKYQFTFDYDNNKIGFYDYEFKTNEINNLSLNYFSFNDYKFFSLIIIFAAILVIIINIGYKNKNKNRNRNINNITEEELIELN